MLLLIQVYKKNKNSRWRFQSSDFQKYSKDLVTLKSQKQGGKDSCSPILRAAPYYEVTIFQERSTKIRQILSRNAKMKMSACDNLRFYAMNAINYLIKVKLSTFQRCEATSIMNVLIFSIIFKNFNIFKEMFILVR